MTGACPFRCNNDASCLPRRNQVCDGRPDCGDLSDEADCPPAAPLLHPLPNNPLAKPYTDLMEEISGVQICIVAVALVLTLGLITCVINHYNKMGGRSWSGDQRRHSSTRKPKNATATRALCSPAQKAAVRKEELLHQEHQLQMLSVQRDFALDYPHSVCRPDLPECRNIDSRTCEVPKTYIRPPPNRMVCSVGRVCPGASHEPHVHKQRTYSSNHTARHELVTHTSLLPASTRSSRNGGDYALDRWQPPGGGHCAIDLFADSKEIVTDDLPPKYEDVVLEGPQCAAVHETRDVHGH